jgi:hypothetical protein
MIGAVPSPENVELRAYFEAKTTLAEPETPSKEDVAVEPASRRLVAAEAEFNAASWP